MSRRVAFNTGGWLGFVEVSIAFDMRYSGHHLMSLPAPQIVQNIIQGVFPPILLAVIFLILPYLLKGAMSRGVVWIGVDFSFRPGMV